MPSTVAPAVAGTPNPDATSSFAASAPHSLVEDLDIAALVGGFLADSGLLDAAFGGLGRLFGRIPATAVTWLGTDVRTPQNSKPPVVYGPAGEAMTGVILMDAGRPAYWLLVPGAGRPMPASAGGRAWPGESSVPWCGPRSDEPKASEPWTREPWAR